MVSLQMYIVKRDIDFHLLKLLSPHDTYPILACVNHHYKNLVSNNEIYLDFQRYFCNKRRFGMNSKLQEIDIDFCESACDAFIEYCCHKNIIIWRGELSLKPVSRMLNTRSLSIVKNIYSIMIAYDVDTLNSGMPSISSFMLKTAMPNNILVIMWLWQLFIDEYRNNVDDIHYILSDVICGIPAAELFKKIQLIIGSCRISGINIDIEKVISKAFNSYVSRYVRRVTEKYSRTSDRNEEFNIYVANFHKVAAFYKIKLCPSIYTVDVYFRHLRVDYFLQDVYVLPNVWQSGMIHIDRLLVNMDDQIAGKFHEQLTLLDNMQIRNISFSNEFISTINIKYAINPSEFNREVLRYCYMSSWYNDQNNYIHLHIHQSNIVTTNNQNKQMFLEKIINLFNEPVMCTMMPIIMINYLPPFLIIMFLMRIWIMTNLLIMQ